MDIAEISQTLRDDAVVLVFTNVLMQQLGLPVPAVPTLLLAGSMAVSSSALGQVLAAAIIASVIADWIWYWSGRVFGYKVLAGLCKLSINPSSCVSQTETRFIRWGLSSVIVAKFIPGFSTVAPPIAGALRMSQPGFLVAAGIGAGLWAGLALGVGWLLQDTVKAAIVALDEHVGRLAAVVIVLLAAWLAWKVWQKYRFTKFSAIPHITPDELIDALQSERPPLMLDLRSATMIAATGPIPGAQSTTQDALLETVSAWPKDHAIVTVCACPQDASAIQAARALRRAGYASARPLRGGYEAWTASTRRPAQSVTTRAS